MITVESDCYDCELPCLYESCPHYRVTRYYCDKCYENVDELYIFNGEQLCKDCVLKQLERVEFDD